MSKEINAVGKACPMPVIMTKKEMDQGEENLVTLVDNAIAVENLKKLSNSMGYSLQYKEEEGIYRVAMAKACEACNILLEELEAEKKESLPEQRERASDYVVFIGREFIGEGSEELGKNLMKMFFYTLTESKELPSCLLFMNGGVKLATLEEEIIGHLKVLSEKQVEILVCGTCLNYYGLTEKLKIGKISNMYEITEKMKEAGKVISF